ncbi:hypothetical protein XAB3213_2540003 [Xanthomonas citri pv. bilvae]|nr:hypothetical protein XAB3213_2540003 [Xanthomonas citri pv. bilvae]
MGDVSQTGAHLVSGNGTAWVGFQRIKGRANLCMQPGFLGFLLAHHVLTLKLSCLAR